MFRVAGSVSPTILRPQNNLCLATSPNPKSEPPKSSKALHVQRTAGIILVQGSLDRMNRLFIEKAGPNGMIHDWTRPFLSDATGKIPWAVEAVDEFLFARFSWSRGVNFDRPWGISPSWNVSKQHTSGCDMCFEGHVSCDVHGESMRKLQ